jgi:hypothetical protein
MLNRPVVELLETYLEAARKYPFSWAGIVMVGHPNVAACDFGGEVGLEEHGMDALKILGARLRDSIDNWQLPEQNPELDQSYAVYNLAMDSLGFEFINWLVYSEMARRRAGAPAPLKVGFYKGKNDELVYNLGVRHVWLSNVFRPALKFIGAVEDDRAIAGFRNRGSCVRRICEGFKSGEQVPVFKPANPLKDSGYITITLRELEYYNYRNSVVDVWLQVATTLQAQGERIVFIRDTAKPWEPLDGFQICPKASLDLDTRMAMYGGAKLNFFSPNGPWQLALFSERPWIQMIDVKAGQNAMDATCNPDFWTKELGIEMGDQFPWQRRDQRIVWKPETYDNIMSAYRELKLAA